MNSAQKFRKGKHRRKPVRFQTTLFDLVRELSRLTPDDNLVVAAVKDIVNSCRARFGSSLAPVKLVATNRPVPHPNPLPQGEGRVRVSVRANCRSTRLLYSYTC